MENKYSITFFMRDNVITIFKNFDSIIQLKNFIKSTIKTGLFLNESDIMGEYYYYSPNTINFVTYKKINKE